MTTSLVFGLGSNVGDREDHLVWALRRLAAVFGPLWVAPLYRSQPVSELPQDDYLNTVAIARGTSRARPRDAGQWRDVIAQLKAWERLAGRREGPRNGPRPLDIDLLMWGDAACAVEGPRGEAPEVAGVVVPHPRWWQRRFVLEPWAALSPELRPPGHLSTVGECLTAVGSQQEVERLVWNPRLLPGWKIGQPWSPDDAMSVDEKPGVFPETVD